MEEVLKAGQKCNDIGVRRIRRQDDCKNDIWHNGSQLLHVHHTGCTWIKRVHSQVEWPSRDCETSRPYLIRLSNRQRVAVNRDDQCLAVATPITIALEAPDEDHEGRQQQRSGVTTAPTDNNEAHSAGSGGSGLRWLFLSTTPSHKTPIRDMAEMAPTKRMPPT
ncbi:hypothetical protein PR048_025139 [Dryococelus australis]|uniref:Uncharacterized protein n=1 Tax=Dryococelus australis TaxID=614101 RepID=A0ABQ9GQJ5_9NEOP|nr:hypothetical protein PR048_025139 [Dryococelus australis]